MMAIIYYFLKFTLIWWLIFLGAIHIITTLSLMLDWESQRDFALDEHIRILFVTLIGAIVFSFWDTFKKIWVELKRREQE